MFSFFPLFSDQKEERKRKRRVRREMLRQRWLQSGVVGPLESGLDASELANAYTNLVQRVAEHCSGKKSTCQGLVGNWRCDSFFYILLGCLLTD